MATDEYHLKGEDHETLYEVEYSGVAWRIELTSFKSPPFPELLGITCTGLRHCFPNICCCALCTALFLIWGTHMLSKESRIQSELERKSDPRSLPRKSPQLCTSFVIKTSFGNSWKTEWPETLHMLLSTLFWAVLWLWDRAQ